MSRWNSVLCPHPLQITAAVLLLRLLGNEPITFGGLGITKLSCAVHFKDIYSIQDVGEVMFTQETRCESNSPLAKKIDNALFSLHRDVGNIGSLVRHVAPPK